MRKLLKPLYVVFAVAVMMASCLNSKDDEVTLYNDMAITQFTLGTLNRYLHTTSSTGGDSIYKTTITGSNYKMSIDQLNHRIFNADSLPTGTDVTHVLCTVYALNSTGILIKDVASDTLRYYNSSDSVDFTSPREFRVYATDGSGYQPYTVTVNVHQQEGDVFATWNQMADQPELAALTGGMRAVALADRVCVFGTGDDNITYGYYTELGDGTTWRQLQSDVNTVFAGDAWQNIVTSGDRMYMLSNGSLFISEDGEHWTGGTMQSGISRLVAASSTELYALNEDGMLMKAKVTAPDVWTEELIDDDASLLPAQDIAYDCSSMAKTASTDYVLLVGNRMVGTDSTAVIWRKIVDYSTSDNVERWVYMERSNADRLALPSLENLQLVHYDDGVLAFGGKGRGASTKAAFSQIYQSRDGGLTWKNNSLYQLPTDLQSSEHSFTAVCDRNNYLWIICGETGQLWRGRLNRLGWGE